MTLTHLQHKTLKHHKSESKHCGVARFSPPQKKWSNMLLIPPKSSMPCPYCLLHWPSTGGSSMDVPFWALKGKDHQCLTTFWVVNGFRTAIFMGLSCVHLCSGSRAKRYIHWSIECVVMPFQEAHSDSVLKKKCE